MHGTLPVKGEQDNARPTFAWEPLAKIAPELPRLFLQHWREIGLNHEQVPLEPHWPNYFQLELAGILRILTVRSNGVLVGYHFLIVMPHLHYASTLSAETDMFWLDPAYRSGLTGYRLLKVARDALREWGVKQHKINEKLHRPTMQPLLQRLGYKPIETAYSQVL